MQPTLRFSYRWSSRDLKRNVNDNTIQTARDADLGSAKPNCQDALTDDSKWLLKTAHRKWALHSVEEHASFRWSSTVERTGLLRQKGRSILTRLCTHAQRCRSDHGASDTSITMSHAELNSDTVTCDSDACESSRNAVEKRILDTINTTEQHYQ